MIGVLPANFQFPTWNLPMSFFHLRWTPQSSRPRMADSATRCNVRAAEDPGATISQAYAQMQPLFDADLKWFPASAKSELRLSIRSLHDRETRGTSP